jgi:hypothetical protein
MSLALVYLSRGLGAGCGISALKDFLNAYRVFPAGCPHELIVITKGWSGVEGQDQLEPILRAHAARVVALPDDGFDWGAYIRLVPHLSQEWLCFLNTYSRPRVAGWLNLMRMAAETSGMDTGAVGATGSWETLAPVFPQPSVRSAYNTPLIYPLMLVYNTARFLMNIPVFRAFPNPHLRTNAFIVRRELFLDFVATQKFPRSKRDVAIMESGRTGFTAYLYNRSLKVLVTGADGKAYEREQWIDSRTFRVHGQPNLLVADNHTIAYDNAHLSAKRALEIQAWGQSFSDNNQSFNGQKDR